MHTHGRRLVLRAPITVEEFRERAPQLVCVSATPGPWELEHSARIVEQVIRPTGLVDPEVEVRATEHQVDDLMNEVRQRVEHVSSGHPSELQEQ